MWKETYICEKRRIFAKETYICEKRPIYVEQDLHVETEVYSQKETYIREKRPVCVIHVCLVRQLCGHKFTYAERDLYVRKVTYFCEQCRTLVT